jgi:formamidopyrimidine-DNA glycosylase
MPELPEMETYRTLLARTVLSQTITQPEVNREKTINVGVDEFADRVQGQRIVAIDRRAKQLLFRLESGDVLLLHLMLGGWITYGHHEDAPEHQSQVVLLFDTVASCAFMVCGSAISTSARNRRRKQN